MQVNELIEKAQVLMDSTGKKKAILLDYAFWEELARRPGIHGSPRP